MGPIRKGLRIDKRTLVPASGLAVSSSLHLQFLIIQPLQSLLTASLAAVALLSVRRHRNNKMRFLSLFALAAPLVSAIQFQEPYANSTLKKGETYSVKWSSVDTDPTVFSIFLVNFVDWPPFYTQIASDVPTSEGEHEVTVPCDVNSSWGFQL